MHAPEHRDERAVFPTASTTAVQRPRDTPALRAPGVFEVLEIRDGQLRACVDGPAC